MNIAIKKSPISAAIATASLLALALLFYGATTLSAQTTSQTTPPQYRDNDITRQEIADMDRFLDNHPEIAEQLRRDPSRIDNREFVANHPALQEYLQKHPLIRKEFKENPTAFMRREERYERQEDRSDRDRDRDRDRDDITRREVADMDRFLDSHREIDEQLRKDPSLIDNREWVANHPALQKYLQKHPEVREEIKENPNAFMRQEDRYERSESDRDHDRGMRTGDRDERNRYGDDDNGREMASFGQFLGAHSSMAAELSKDPSLANNKEYLASHPELDAYLKAHPMMSQQLAANPQSVMNSNWMQQQNGTTVVKPATPTEKPPTQ
jgi:hypothetical protein